MSSTSKTKIIDLYAGNMIQIWTDDDEEEGVTISIAGRVTVYLDKADFQELYNAVFIAKQMLKDMESKK